MSMNTSVKSTALEPAKGAPWYHRLTSVYGLVILTVVIFAIFAILKPATFPTLLNFRLLTSGNSVQLILAFGVTLPMVAGKIDLSIGYSLGLWQVMSLVWQLDHINFVITIVLCILGGALIGALNALLIELAQVDSFIATLATGQVVYAVTYWVTGGNQITDSTGIRAKAFDQLGTWMAGPIPGIFITALAIGLVIWILLGFLPAGRYLYAVGANPRAAELTGIRRRSYVIGAMVASGVLAAVAGVLLESQQAGVAQASIGPEYMLPAIAAAFLGSTTIKPGRINALGTLVGVAVTTIGIAGLEQLLPGQFFLVPLFDGLTLIAAIVIASLASRRRLSRADTPTAAPPATANETNSDSDPGTAEVIPRTADPTESADSHRIPQ